MVVAPNNELSAPTNGEATEPSREPIDVMNPATGGILRSVPHHDPDHVRAEMARVRAATPRWAALSVEARCDKIARVRDVIARRTDEIARVITEENGKPLQESLLLDVAPTLMTMSYFIDNAPRILTPERIHLAYLKHRRSYIAYKPKGVISIINPWNFPFFMPGSDVAMALISGNGVLLKPSEVTPLSALLLKDCYDEAGFEDDLFRVVTGLGDTGAALIDAMPDHVLFTGSVPTGRRIAVACAERYIPYTLELGGKAPAVVLSDADVERAAQAIVWGGFAGAGQVCASVERVYAPAGVYDALVDRVTELTRALRVGPPLGNDTVDVGSMTWPRQRDIALSIVEDARDKGARITTGGKIPPGQDQGLFFEPTVIADCSHDMKVMTDEIFGPVIGIMKVSSEAEAVELANDSHLGLGAYVFTRDAERGRQVAEQIRTGAVTINDVIMHAGMPEMPWGGVKQSGCGIVRSDRGLRELCDQQHVNEDRLPVNMPRDPQWFPYTRKTTEVANELVRKALGGTVAAKVLRMFIR